MRIVLLSAEYPPTPGGVGDYTQALAITLAAYGEDVEIWTIRNGMVCSLNPRTPDQLGMPIAPASWGWDSWGAIRAGLRREMPDIFHIQYQTGAYAMHPAINLLPSRLRLDRECPQLVVTAHDLLLPYLFPKAGPFRNWMMQRLFDASDAAIVTNSEDLLATTGVPLPGTSPAPRYHGRLQQPAHLIPIGSNITPMLPADYDRRAWRQTLGITAETTLIAYFGLISPSKGLDTLLDSLETLPQHITLLVIGGDSPAPQDRAHAEALRERIASGSLKGRVLITGHCPAHEVSAHLVAADLAALPFTDGASFRRGSLLAAMAHGLPVITTEPQNQEPRTKNRRTQNPEPQNRRTAEPRTQNPEPRTAEPRTAEPRTAEPRTAEPRTAEPRTAEPRTGAPSEPQKNRGAIWATKEHLLAFVPSFLRVERSLAPENREQGNRRTKEPRTNIFAAFAASREHQEPQNLVITPALPELIHNQNALLIPVGDPAALAAAIQQIASDPQLRSRLRVGAHELAAHFGWDAIAEQHIALYTALLHKLPINHKT
jgi:polysaccharide biosynthesis protein PslF